MRLFKIITFSSLFLILGIFSLQADGIDRQFNQAAEILNRDFFYWMFKEEGLTKAYILAQEEDFEPGAPRIVTRKMEALMELPLERWHERVGNLAAVHKFNKTLRGLTGDRLGEVLQGWRYLFLSKMTEYMRYRNSLKPIYSLTASAKVAYDTNINRVDPDDPNANTPGGDGKKDWQKLVMASLTLKPFINNKNFSRKFKFDQISNAMRMIHDHHLSNDAAIFDTTSKLTRSLGGKLKDFSIAYRLQHFSLGSETSRSPSASFLSHRVAGSLNSSDLPVNWGMIKKTNGKLIFDWTAKDKFNDTKVASNADRFRFGVAQKFYYNIGKQSINNSFGYGIEYIDYQTDSDSTGNYNYITLNLEHKHSHKFMFIDRKFKFSEKFSYRAKEWEHYTDTGSRDENFYYLQVGASTKLNKKLTASFKLRQAWKNDDYSDTTTAEANANQTIVTFGLSWRTP